MSCVQLSDGGFQVAYPQDLSKCYIDMACKLFTNANLWYLNTSTASCCASYSASCCASCRATLARPGCRRVTCRRYVSQKRTAGICHNTGGHRKVFAGRTPCWRTGLLRCVNPAAAFPPEAVSDKH